MSILDLSFNNIGTHLTCSNESGYLLYSLSPGIEKKKYVQKDGGVGFVKLLCKSNLSLISGGGSRPFIPRDTFMVWDEKEGKAPIKIALKEEIRNGLITQKYIVAVLKNKVCVFDFDTEIKDMKTTYNNDNGICVINNDNVRPIIVTLGTRKGQIAIWKINHENYYTINAHENNIEAVAINEAGTLVATASESGTLIKVFEIETKKLKHEFRRGTTSTKIYDLAFNWNSEVLACCSGNGTIHLFQLIDSETNNTQSMFSGFKDYLPSYFGSLWSSKKHYVDTTAKMICCFDEAGSLHVVSYDGKYYKITGNEYQNIVSQDLQINSK